MFDRLKWFVFSVLCGLLWACSGGGGSSGGSAAVTPPPSVSSGSLAVSVTGLPANAAALVRVTGPGNLARDLTQTSTLADLAPGSYTVAASLVSVAGVGFTPAPLTQTVTVAAGATANAAIAYANAPLALRAVEAVQGPSAVNPVFLTAPPGDARQFVVERAGRIRILINGNFLAAPFADISARVLTTGEGGLLSMAFDPAFASNGRVYLYYTDLNQNIVIERLTVSNDANLADPASSLVIIRIPHPTYQNHFGGLVAFGPDGYLYLGTGDGGSAGDPPRNAQNLNVLLGKMLRLDVSAASAAQPYSIPPGNPYVNQSGRRAEIWASGLRNPWRYTFDGARLYIADVGQDAREEIDVAAASAAGLNYGWNITEGSICYNATSCDRTGLTAPVFDYDHSGGACSITGGFVYRGAALPELAGHYFYSDYCAGFIKSGVVSGGALVSQRDWGIANLGNVVSFGRDGQGELYIISGNSKIYRLARAGQ
ncbi:MAG: glucose dehydrogenase [Massilia sp.]|nr:glucose dehydrogenase [Massilia sp.]